ncbi:hypothetical protein BCR33DRAFT_712397 [Rhizoclosmatium globosum]|uniref:Receptor ligand binding region domain-containing protein n=1 Tax=Rhizoclosmatium globosum TaxID=329046 RepID=A0A1Y2CY86_9FUNG|nr:hypothetical protein BCR33DRAFT_712397 [Rhizoclosmatium globosum]|eukprot:ORY51305.1 hypothetical protein BCR33DRAFT_712397 [Rhizoclosmatium globosum]
MNSITLAFITSYCAIPGLQFNNSLVLNYDEVVYGGLSDRYAMNVHRLSCAKERNVYSAKSGGFAGTITARDIIEQHSDVIGVIGAEYSAAVRTGVSYFQIPHCAATSLSNYPYFWRTIPSSVWNVRKVALLYQTDDQSSNDILCGKILDQSDTHYIIICGQPEFITGLMFNLGVGMFDCTMMMLLGFKKRIAPLIFLCFQIGSFKLYELYVFRNLG